MSSLDKMLGWFPHSSTEWIELIIVALLLWLWPAALPRLAPPATLARRPTLN
jgi:hypothetical protein